MSNINDVARLAQVSKATVSRVLSGSRGVKEESRQAVLRAAEILNYTPNAIAQSLSSLKNSSINITSTCYYASPMTTTAWYKPLRSYRRGYATHW